jgi:hypothetical protein
MIIYLGISLSTPLISMWGAAEFLPIFAKKKGVAIDKDESARRHMKLHLHFLT